CDDPAIGGEDFPEVAGPIGGGLVDRAGVHHQEVAVGHTVRVPEGDVVVLQHRLQPVITAAELALHTEGAFLHRQVGDLGQLADAQLFGGPGAHGEAVGVVHRRGRQPGQPVLQVGVVYGLPLL